MLILQTTIMRVRNDRVASPLEVAVDDGVSPIDLWPASSLAEQLLYARCCMALASTATERAVKRDLSTRLWDLVRVRRPGESRLTEHEYGALLRRVRGRAA